MELLALIRRAAPAVLVAVLLAAVPAHAETTVTGDFTAATATAPGTATATAPAPATSTLSIPTDYNALSGVSDLSVVPANHRMTGQQVENLANAVPKIAAVRKEYKGSYPGVFLKGPGRWQVSYYAKPKPLHEIGQVIIDDATGKVTEAWTGYQVPWTMARGYPGAFGRKVTAIYIWLPLTLLFLAPFFTRPLRLLHLDLAVLASLGISLAFFDHANLGLSVPLSAPPMFYLLARMAWIGLRRSPEGEAREREPLKLLVPASWLLIGVVFLMGFRIGLNVTNSNVIDVGYASVVGANRLADGSKVYGNFPADVGHGDTYGPVTYEAYVPFERALGFSGKWDDLPAAHGAAIVFDLLAVALLFLLGRRVRGPNTGIVLAWAWCTYPFTIFVESSNSNDTLVPVFLIAALYFAAKPAARGATAALGGLTKFAGLALAPLFATHGLEPGASVARRARPVVLYSLAFLFTTALVSLPVVAHGETPRLIYDRTIGYQAGRPAPFSIWGFYGWKTPQHIWQALTILFALAVAVIPRRRDVIGLAACAAAVVIAFELSATYWFYLYIVWFFPLVAVALFGRHAEPAR